MESISAGGLPPSEDLVFVRSYRHYRTGKRVYAKPGKVFCFPRRRRRRRDKSEKDGKQ